MKGLVSGGNSGAGVGAEHEKIAEGVLLEQTLRARVQVGEKASVLWPARDVVQGQAFEGQG